MSGSLTNEEKKAIARARQSAVRHAWKEEQARVKEGRGTRDWTPSQQKEILERGSVKGYDGHHMKSVSQFPEYAGDSKNIQFLSEQEHFEGAHQGSYSNLTNGYYDPETKTMNEFDGDELREVPVTELSEAYSYDDAQDISSLRDEYSNEATEAEGADKSSIEEARSDYAQSDSLESSNEASEGNGESSPSESNSGSASSEGSGESASNGIGR